MATREHRGRRRSKLKQYPSHIDPDQLPKKCYWDESGNGHWYTTYRDTVTGKPRRRTIAGPEARHSDLHKAIESTQGVEVDCVNWLDEKFKASPQYKSAGKSQRKMYDYGAGIVKTEPTVEKGVFVGQIPLGDWDSPLAQKLIDAVAVSRGPSAAKKLMEYLRRLFNWGRLRGHYRAANPVVGLEMPKERKLQRNPTHQVLGKILTFAIERGERKAHTKGSCAPYIWKALILNYECRLRGIESWAMSDADLTDVGIDCTRAKGSRDNTVEWNRNLEICVNAAQVERQRVWTEQKRPRPIRPEDRPLLVNGSGDRITESTWQSAWKRFMALAVKEEVITKEEKFGLHDMKRRGTTDMKGTRAEKLEATGLSGFQVLSVYDKAKQVVKATSR